MNTGVVCVVGFSLGSSAGGRPASSRRRLMSGETGRGGIAGKAICG